MSELIKAGSNGSLCAPAKLSVPDATNGGSYENAIGWHEADAHAHASEIGLKKVSPKTKVCLSSGIAHANALGTL